MSVTKIRFLNLTKMPQIWTNKAIILLMVLYGCETLTIIFFENKCPEDIWTREDAVGKQFKIIHNEGFKVLTAVVMKTTNFWDITPCSPLKVNRRFGRTYSLHLQCRRISQARYQRESSSDCHLISSWYLARLIRLWRWRRYVPRNIGWLSTDYTAWYTRR
jgi:hypothetical protein